MFILVLIGLGKVAVAMNASFLVPFIFSVAWWIVAGYNFHIARVQSNMGERAGSFVRGIGIFVATVPFFLPQVLGRSFVAFIVYFIVGYPLLCGVLPALVERIVIRARRDIK